MAELAEEQFAAAVATWRERMRAHGDAAYVQLIVNEGAGAGASLEHTHAQLYALPFVPATRWPASASGPAPTASGPPAAACSATSSSRRCAARERLVAIDEEAALICPWASRSPFELRVVPRRAAARFEDDSGGGGDDPHRAAGAGGPLRRPRRS